MAQPFVPIPNCVKVEFFYTVHGQQVENVYHVLSGDNVTEDSLRRIVSKMKAWWLASIKPLISQGALLRTIKASDLTASDSFGYEQNIFEFGGVGGEPMPGNVTFSVKHTTGRRGRSHRGRTYQVGVHQGMVSGNLLLVNYANAFRLAYEALRRELATGAAIDVFVVASRRQEGQWLAEGEAYPVTGSSVEGNLDSQRRRLTGPGRGN